MSGLKLVSGKKEDKVITLNLFLEDNNKGAIVDVGNEQLIIFDFEDAPLKPRIFSIDDNCSLNIWTKKDLIFEIDGRLFENETDDNGAELLIFNDMEEALKKFISLL